MLQNLFCRHCHYCHYCHYFHYCQYCNYYHFCHNCHNCHNCHYCHYFYYCCIDRKATFSQRCPTDQPTDRPTTRLLKLLWAAKNAKMYVSEWAVLQCCNVAMLQCCNVSMMQCCCCKLQQMIQIQSCQIDGKKFDEGGNKNKCKYCPTLCFDLCKKNYLGVTLRRVKANICNHLNKQAWFVGCVQTLSDATPSMGKIHLLNKMAVTFEPMQRFNLYILWDLEFPKHQSNLNLPKTWSSCVILTENVIFFSSIDLWKSPQKSKLWIL